MSANKFLAVLLFIIVELIFNVNSYANDFTEITSGAAYDNTINIINSLREALEKNNGLLISNIASKEYKNGVESGNKFLQDTVSAAQKATIPSMSDQWLSNFGFYSIDSVEKIILKDKIIFLQCKVTFHHPLASIPIICDYKKGFFGPVYCNLGGFAGSSDKFVDGKGRVTFQLILEDGLYRLHYAYFSLQPLAPDVLDNMYEDLRGMLADAKP